MAYTIGDELGRIEQAKINIAAAIQNKGVTVPAGSLLSAMPSYIDQIPSGGVVPSGNIMITQQTGTDVTNYATASVKSAAAPRPTATAPSTILATASPTASDYYLRWISAGVGWVDSNTGIKIKGDSNLVASNIKKDVSIFGVTGTYEVLEAFTHIKLGAINDFLITFTNTNVLTTPSIVVCRIQKTMSTSTKTTLATITRGNSYTLASSYYGGVILVGTNSASIAGTVRVHITSINGNATLFDKEIKVAGVGSAGTGQFIAISFDNTTDPAGNSSYYADISLIDNTSGGTAAGREIEDLRIDCYTDDSVELNIDLYNPNDIEVIYNVLNSDTDVDYEASSGRYRGREVPFENGWPFPIIIPPNETVYLYVSDGSSATSFSCRGAVATHANESNKYVLMSKQQDISW